LSNISRVIAQALTLLSLTLHMLAERRFPHYGLWRAQASLARMLAPLTAKGICNSSPHLFNSVLVLPPTQSFRDRRGLIMEQRDGRRAIVESSPFIRRWERARPAAQNRGKRLAGLGTSSCPSLKTPSRHLQLNPIGRFPVPQHLPWQSE
jgi:hypothetical protein